METEEYVKMEFSYTDEFGQESHLTKTIASNVLDDMVTPFELLVENFQNFLLGAGFSQETVDTIQIIKKQ